MEISFIHTQILVHLHVNKTNFHVKGFALGLASKQVKGNSEIAYLNASSTNSPLTFEKLSPKMWKLR